MNFIKETNIKIEKEGIMSNEPFIPFNQILFEIPKNLPIESTYKINVENIAEKPIGEKVEILNSTLNNIIEILSFLTLRQLPEIKETILEEIEKLKVELKDINYEYINTIKYEDTEVFDESQEGSSSRKKLKIVPPFRIA